MLMRTLTKSKAQQCVLAQCSVDSMHYNQRLVRKQLIDAGIISVQYRDGLVITQVYGWTIAANSDKQEAASTISAVSKTITFLKKEGKFNEGGKLK